MRCGALIFANYFNPAEDKAFIKAIFDPEMFKAYVEEKKGKIAEKMGGG